MDAVVKSIGLILIGMITSFQPTDGIAAQETSFPSVDNSTQRTRDDIRKQILDTELLNESKALADARSALSNAINSKEKKEKLDSLRGEIDLHSKNVIALNTEIKNLQKQHTAAVSEKVIRVSGKKINEDRKRESTPYWDVYNRSSSSEESE